MLRAMNPDLIALMLAQGGVFTAAQAAAFGMNEDELRFELRRKHLVRVRHRVFSTADLIAAADPAGRHRICAAAAMLKRGWSAQTKPPFPLVAGHGTAAAIWGLPTRNRIYQPPRSRTAGSAPAQLNPIPDALPGFVELVSADRCKRTYRAAVGVRPAALPAHHVAVVDGVPVTSLARTAVDLMRESPRQDAHIIADAALRLGCDKTELQAAAATCATWRGGRQAVEAAAFADARAASAAESVTRLLLADNGVPTPELQYEIRDSQGRKRLLDIALVETLVAVEPDGKVKFTDSWGDPGETLWKEKLREDSIRDIGWEFVRPTWQQLMTSPGEVVARVWAAIARSERRPR